jgi:hypothetical protein
VDRNCSPECRGCFRGFRKDYPAAPDAGEVEEITGAKVLSLHHDISTVTGEEFVVFTLAESPHFREIKKKSRASGEPALHAYLSMLMRPILGGERE